MTNLSKAERAKYDLVIGSRRQVYNGTAHHTSGGLTKNKLIMTKNGRIVSKSKHFSAFFQRCDNVRNFAFIAGGR